ncbi:cutinase [Colletotrichum paranaense]|uniref:cutinase n=3 Tax=Colletotrichum acutatum species complex TaxID=2707335 RepID=A0AAI9XX59_9PEZI|nr:cutinase [Colletotrichum paranaense]KAK0372613.1 cutinase [Colletotrichum limetticola]KAK1464009.1 cutinase [Colletotrichum melonis]KAK1535809.1 cutinase [Colletotrichum paranaense]
MKFSAILALASIAAAFPTLSEPELDERDILEIEARDIEARQRGRVGSTAKEFSTGGCKDVVMVFARGSTEIGNMGTICGPQTANNVKGQFSSVAVEGVDYAAGLSTNFLPGGADPAGVAEMKRIIGEVNSQCPNSMMVVGGYSQGAAVTHRAVEDLPQAQKDQIVAAFMFGDTQNTQDKAQIPNFPKSKTKIICAQGDAVCKGTLTILPAHLSYGNQAGNMADFINQKLTAAGAQRRK